MFRPGKNAVTLTLRDACGTSYGSEAYYLVGPVSILPSRMNGQWGRGHNPGRSGDPVDTATGNFSTTEVDLPFPPHVLGLDWSRTYNSGDATQGPLGPGWSGALSRRVVEAEDGSVTLIEDDGRRIDFLKTAGIYEPQVPFDGRLARPSPDTFVVECSTGETWRFRADGRLVEQRAVNGQVIALQYEADRLVRASAPQGRSLDFLYQADQLLASVRADDGRTVSYTYADGFLEAVTDPGGATTRYRYDDDGRLNQIIDPDGRLRLTLVYDAEGRVTGQGLAGGESTTFAYDTEARSTTVTDSATGAQMVYGHDGIGQLESLTDPPACSPRGTLCPTRQQGILPPVGLPCRRRRSGGRRRRPVGRETGWATRREPVLRLLRRRAEGHLARWEPDE